MNIAKRSFLAAAIVAFSALLIGMNGSLQPSSAEARAESVSITSQQCAADGRVLLTLDWASDGQGVQWVDVSFFDAGFADGTFTNFGPLPAGQSQVSLSGIEPGFTQYLRVNTLHADGWHASNTLKFTPPFCTAGQPLGADNLSVTSQTCNSAGRVNISLLWQPSGNGQQWVDLSLFNNGFQPGSFLGQGPLAASQSQFAWNGLLPGRMHFLRVNTLTGFGWQQSATIGFITPGCGGSGGSGDYSAQPRSLTGNAAPTAPAILSDVRIGAHPAEGYDRIVFEFQNAQPDAQINYVDQASACGSGAPVSVAGTAILSVRLEPSRAHNEAGGSTVNQIVTGTGSAITEAERICDFEGVVTWAVGIDSQAPFLVTTLNNPPRIVIDVQRQGRAETQALSEFTAERFGAEYAGSCSAATLPSNIGQYCGELYADLSGVAVYRIGRTFTEFSQWVVLTGDNGDLQVTGTAAISQPVPWPAGYGMPQVVEYTRQDLTGRLGVALSNIRIELVERVQWPGGCLGLPAPGEFCTLAIVPGYRVVLGYQGQTYEYHTDLETDFRAAF